MTLILLCLSLLLLIPAVLLFVQTISALRPHAHTPPSSGRPAAVVLIPAHNEGETVAASLTALIPQLRPHDRLLVVADNCSDDTAAVARSVGAEVIERHDPTLRGKGYALDFGIRHLMAAPPPVVVIVDADCALSAHNLDVLVHQANARGRPIQGLYLMHAPEGAGLKTRIAEFAWLFRNLVRAQGYKHLGLPCQLMGSGMAFPWPLLTRHELASGEIVEDLKLGLACVAAGHGPELCTDAVITSSFPSSASGLASQRTRWEHGHLNLVTRVIPPLLWQALRTRNPALFALAFDAAIPPLALFSMLLAGLLLVTLGTALLGGSLVPLAMALLANLALGSAVLIAWQRWGRDIVSLRDLLSIPFYVLGKLPLYFRFLVARQKSWVRTDRGSGQQE